MPPAREESHIQPRHGTAIRSGARALRVAWGWHDGAWALVARQVGRFVMNLRGANDNGA